MKKISTPEKSSVFLPSRPATITWTRRCKITCKCENRFFHKPGIVLNMVDGVNMGEKDQRIKSDFYRSLHFVVLAVAVLVVFV